MTAKRSDAATHLILDTIDLIAKMLRHELTTPELALTATTLITALEEHAKLYTTNETNPTTRAWYLLRECMQHRTLLKP